MHLREAVPFGQQVEDAPRIGDEAQHAMDMRVGRRRGVAIQHQYR